jgi:hypothetical protein
MTLTLIPYWASSSFLISSSLSALRATSTKS